MEKRRKYPVGIQSFEEIRTGGYLYVDKSALIHELAEEGKYYFINRPRRFGKSLLISTIAAYFEGRKDLFEGLAAEMQEEVREMMRNLFSPIKEAGPMLRFVLFTGITKFSQMSVFSELNNLSNISMVPKYDALCGITEEELHTYMRPDVEHLATVRGETTEQTYAELKDMYDGYHFSEGLTDIYNPYSLLRSLTMTKMENFWFATATPTLLIKLMRHQQLGQKELEDLEGTRVNANEFDIPVEGNITNILPILFQSGYLTIKQAQYLNRRYYYILGFPNREVREGFANCLVNYMNADP